MMMLFGIRPPFPEAAIPSVRRYNYS